MHGYSHLLTGAARGLKCASCLHIDDIGKPVNIDELIEYAMAFFDEIGEIPIRVSYQLSSEDKRRRSSILSFRKKFENIGGNVGGAIHGVEIISSGFEKNDISNAWTPRAVFSITCHGKVLEAFLQSPQDLDKDGHLLIQFALQKFATSFSAAYIFSYPLLFSPVAYSAGLSYSPNRKLLGRATNRDAERVANWANHCYRGHRASEGYLRDVYPINIIGRTHLERNINNVNLYDWIKQNRSHGKLSIFQDKILWIIDDENLLDVQHCLDDAKLLLSAFPPNDC